MQGIPRRCLKLLYFAYGSNMSIRQMDRRCPGASAIGAARLDEHAFRINIRTYATVVPSPGESVLGVVWELTPAHESALDRYEGIAENLYYRERQTVTFLEDGQQRECLVYIATHDDIGRPRRPYIAGILEAANHWRFDAAYVDMLSTWQPD